MAEKVKVAYVVVMFPCYSETFVLREILELTRRGVEVTILSLRAFSEKIMDDDARPLLPHTIYSPYLFSFPLLFSNLIFLAKHPLVYAGLIRLFLSRLIRNPVALLKTLTLFPKSVHFARILERRKIQHLHAHFVNYPGTAAYIISRLTGIPFSMTAHAHDIFQNRLLLCEKIARAERTFAISEFNRNYILKSCPGVQGAGVEVVHCGLDLSRVRYGAKVEEGHLILSVGRLVAIKGFDTLIEAVGILRERGRTVRCVIVGEGPERGGLIRMIDRLSLRGVVEMAGEQTPARVRALMERARVFILPSRPADRKSGVMDGIPVSLMEAMAGGVPVISCPVSGIPELVVEGRTGLLVPPGDAKRLADASERLLTDNDLRERCARGGRERIESEFDIRKSVDRVLKVFTRG